MTPRNYSPVEFNLKEKIASVTINVGIIKVVIVNNKCKKLDCFTVSSILRLVVEWWTNADFTYEMMPTKLAHTAHKITTDISRATFK